MYETSSVTTRKRDGEVASQSERPRRSEDEGSSVDRTGSDGTHPVQRLQQRHGNRDIQRAVARHRDETEATGDRSETADRAATTTESFPHRSKIERSMGISIPGRAVSDVAIDGVPRAARTFRADSTGGGGATPPAYTEGTTTYFEDATPDLEVAAHEATHLAQHAGLTRDQGLGPEGHASAVAQRVTAGESARDLLGQRGSRVSSAARPYTEASSGRLSDDETIFVPSGGRHFFATKSRVDDANQRLAQQDARIRLVSKPTSQRTAQGEQRYRVTVRREDQQDTDVLPHHPDMGQQLKGGIEPTKLPDDCAACAFLVRGATGKGETKEQSIAAVVWDKNANGTRKEIQRGGAQSLKRGVLNEHFQDIDESTDTETDRSIQAAIDVRDNPALARTFGINEYADPRGVGDVVVVSTTRTGEQDEQPPAWDYHWGGVIMDSGTDYVLLQNFAGNNPWNWSFELFGKSSSTGSGETFHEAESRTGQFGKAPVTMVVMVYPGSLIASRVFNTRMPVLSPEQ
ncbi:MAG: hypothetical protein ABEI96_05315 [Haloarculaceae archaeon]